MADRVRHHFEPTITFVNSAAVLVDHCTYRDLVKVAQQRSGEKINRSSSFLTKDCARRPTQPDEALLRHPNIGSSFNNSALAVLPPRFLGRRGSIRGLLISSPQAVQYSVTTRTVVVLYPAGWTLVRSQAH